MSKAIDGGEMDVRMMGMKKQWLKPEGGSNSRKKMQTTSNTRRYWVGLK